MENVNMKKIIVYIVMAAAIFHSIIAVSCLTEDLLKVPFQTYDPPDLPDGWDISTPANENIDGDALKSVYQYVHKSDDLWQIRSLLVFRNGKLVAESYMKDSNDRIVPGAIWSCTKQLFQVPYRNMDNILLIVRSNNPNTLYLSF
jgi:hypothetical protein